MPSCGLYHWRNELYHKMGVEMTTNFFEIFNNILNGARNVQIRAYVQMIFYQVNDYLVLRRNLSTVEISKESISNAYLDQTCGVWYEGKQPCRAGVELLRWCGRNENRIVQH